MPGSMSKMSKSGAGTSSSRGLKAIKTGDGDKHPKKDTRAGLNTDRAWVAVEGQNPFLLPPVIQTILNFLPLRDVQNCSQICTLWASLANPYLRKLSQIAVGHKPYCAKRRSEKTNTDFRARLRSSDLPFHALKRRVFNNDWVESPTSVFTEILENWGHRLQELTLKGITLASPSTLSNIVKRIGLKKLDVDILNFPKVDFNLEDLTSINYLRLKEAVLTIKDDCKISPVKLELENCVIMVDIIASSLEYKVNEFIDFSTVTTFQYIGNNRVRNLRVNEENEVPICIDAKLDLSGSCELDLLELHGKSISVMNSKLSNWTIDKLIFLEGQFLNAGLLRVRYFRCLNWNIGASMMPLNVEELYFSCVAATSCSDQRWDTYLPSLKRLTLDQFYTNGLYCFERCPQLESLKLIGEQNGSSIKSFPPGLKNLYLENDRSLTRTIRNSETFELEVLMLMKQSLQAAKKNLKKIRAKNIIWLIKDEPNPPTTMKISSQPVLTNNVSFALGPMNWSKVSFEDSDFATIVTEKSNYYLFEEENLGRAMSKQDFFDMIKKEIKRNFTESFGSDNYCCPTTLWSN